MPGRFLLRCPVEQILPSPHHRGIPAADGYPAELGGGFYFQHGVCAPHEPDLCAEGAGLLLCKNRGVSRGAGRSQHQPCGSDEDGCHRVLQQVLQGHLCGGRLSAAQPRDLLLPAEFRERRQRDARGAQKAARTGAGGCAHGCLDGGQSVRVEFLRGQDAGECTGAHPKRVRPGGEGGADSPVSEAGGRNGGCAGNQQLYRMVGEKSCRESPAADKATPDPAREGAAAERG